MTTINRLSSVDALQPGDLIPVWDTSNGDPRKASMTTLLAFIESYFADPDYTTRIVTPSVDGFNVDVGATGDSSWLIINPTLNFTTASLSLPPETSAVNNQEITVVCTASVASFGVTSLGATVSGAPTQLGTYDSFRIRYNEAQSTWYTLDTTGDGTGTSSILRQQFTGDGTTTTFTLANTPAALGNTLQVFINGVYQERSVYTVSGADVVFSAPPPLTSTIEVLSWEINDIGVTDAALVTYTPRGAAPTATTVEARLQENAAGSEVVTAATSVAVTLANAEADAAYFIIAGSDFNAGGVYTTSRLTTGFTLNWPTSGTGNVWWYLARS